MDRLQELLDKQAVTERLHDYARGADRIDNALVRSVFHPDAEVDYGAMYTGTGYGFADFLDAVHPTLRTHTHHLSNISVRVDGDRAGSETYVLMTAQVPTEDGGLELVSTGRYVDEWERRDGAWRIIRRLYLHSADTTRPVTGDGFPTTGARDRTDPSYRVLGGAPVE